MAAAAAVAGAVAVAAASSSRRRGVQTNRDMTSLEGSLVGALS